MDLRSADRFEMKKIRRLLWFRQKRMTLTKYEDLVLEQTIISQSRLALVARVKAHMARYDRLIGSAAEENKVIEIRGLKIDTTARRVWVNGEEKPFTTKEFDLLTFLASHPNHVYTKDELFSEIWDMESIGDIATVTVHIKKIREKIEFDTSKPQYIETIWGVGYRFKV